MVEDENEDKKDKEDKEDKDGAENWLKVSFN